MNLYARKLEGSLSDLKYKMEKARVFDATISIILFLFVFDIHLVRVVTLNDSILLVLIDSYSDIDHRVIISVGVQRSLC